MLAQQGEHTQRLRFAEDQEHAKLAAIDPLKTDPMSPPANTGPRQKPPRVEADDVVLQAGEAAQVYRVYLRTLSVSHQSTSTQASGRVTLDVSASGSYAALKAWQTALQQRFPALSVQSFRMQASPSSAGAALDAQMIWVLHVRD